VLSGVFRPGKQVTVGGSDVGEPTKISADDATIRVGAHVKLHPRVHAADVGVLSGGAIGVVFQRQGDAVQVRNGKKTVVEPYAALDLIAVIPSGSTLLTVGCLETIETIADVRGRLALRLPTKLYFNRAQHVEKVKMRYTFRTLQDSTVPEDRHRRRMFYVSWLSGPQYPGVKPHCLQLGHALCTKLLSDVVGGWTWKSVAVGDTSLAAVGMVMAYLGVGRVRLFCHTAAMRMIQENVDNFLKDGLDYTYQKCCDVAPQLWTALDQSPDFGGGPEFGVIVVSDPLSGNHADDWLAQVDVLVPPRATTTLLCCWRTDVPDRQDSLQELLGSAFEVVEVVRLDGTHVLLRAVRKDAPVEKPRQPDSPKAIAPVEKPHPLVPSPKTSEQHESLRQRIHADNCALRQQCAGIDQEVAKARSRYQLEFTLAAADGRNIFGGDLDAKLSQQSSRSARGRRPASSSCAGSRSPRRRPVSSSGSSRSGGVGALLQRHKHPPFYYACQRLMPDDLPVVEWTKAPPVKQAAVAPKCYAQIGGLPYVWDPNGSAPKTEESGPFPNWYRSLFPSKAWPVEGKAEAHE